jgi:methionyl aminopeptidase
MLLTLIKPTEIGPAHTAAQRAVEVHRRLAAYVRPGLTLAQIDAFVGKTLDDLDCTSCFKNYTTRGHGPFPSFACVGVNDCIVHGHGLMSDRPVQAGDLLKIDIGVMHKGWIGDVGWTYSLGQPSDLAARLMACGVEALRRGIETIAPTNQLKQFAQAVQTHVETECGFYCVAGLGGHGYGRKLHGPPFVANYTPGWSDSPWPEGKSYWVPGTLIAVEPMINAGTRASREDKHPFNKNWTDWPIYSADGSLSVHFEHDILVTEDGHKVLSEGMEEIENVVAV